MQPYKTPEGWPDSPDPFTDQQGYRDWLGRQHAPASCRVDLIVTQHAPLVRYLCELGIATAETPVIEHARIEDIKGKHVAGVLPVSMAAHCALYTEVPMFLTPDDRAALRQGDLPYERMRQVCGKPKTYAVNEAWVVADMRAELGILASLRRIIAEEHAHMGHCVSIETIMDAAARLRDAWEEQHPRAILVRLLSERVGHLQASVADDGRVHVLHRGTQIWLPSDEQIGDMDAALADALDALGYGGEPRYRLAGRDGFELSERYAALRFVSEGQAWSAAESLFRGFHLAEGPHGVQAIVGPVPV